MGKSNKKRRSTDSSSSENYEWETVKPLSKSNTLPESSNADEFSALLDRVSYKSSTKGTSIFHQKNANYCPQTSGWRKSISHAAKDDTSHPNTCLTIFEKEDDAHHWKGDGYHRPIPKDKPMNYYEDRVKEVEERYVTSDDINAMAAQLLKAEFAGNKEKITKMKSKLEKLREAQRRNLKVRLTKTISVAAGKSKSSEEFVHLTTMGRTGHDIPLFINKSEGKNGNRETINDLIREEKLEAKNFLDEQFASLASRCKGDVDNEYDYAVGSQKFQSQEKLRMRIKSNAISAYKRKKYAESNCSSCIEHMPHYLVMSAKHNMFLSLPEHASLTRGHCLLAPLEHVGAMTRVDESALEEACAIKRQLCRMATLWHGKGASCVFMEVAGYPDLFKHHVQIECIPMDQDTMSELPIYFKKALLDLGSEWDQNKGIVHLKHPGFGARNAIPPNFGYFSVEFGIDGGGYAKVIEDWSSFPIFFGQEIIAGVLGKPTDTWRKPRQDTMERLREKAVEFERKWATMGNSDREHDCRTQYTDTVDTAVLRDPEGPELPPNL